LSEPFAIPVLNSLFGSHLKNIGAALPLALWFIDRATSVSSENDALEGLVLHGKSLTSEDISKHLGALPRNVRNHVARLQDHGYIRKEKNGAGHSFFVIGFLAECAAKKFRGSANGYRAPEDNCHESEKRGKKMPPHNNRVYNPTRNITPQRQNHSAHSAGDPSPDTGKLISFDDAVGALKDHREGMTGPGTFHLGPKDHKTINAWLEANPNISLQQLQLCLSHRARSDINRSDFVESFFPKIMKFEAGPLDRYGQPKGGVNGNAGKSEARNERTKAAVQRGIEEAINELSA
jgi:hypothetical protein